MYTVQDLQPISYAPTTANVAAVERDIHYGEHDGVGEIGRCQWKCGAGPARSGQARTVLQLPTAAASTLTLQLRTLKDNQFFLGRSARAIP